MYLIDHQHSLSETTELLYSTHFLVRVCYPLVFSYCSWGSQGTFHHLIWRAASLEKTLKLEKMEGRRRRGWQRMRWLNDIANSMDVSLGDGGLGSLACCGSWGGRVEHDWANEQHTGHPARGRATLTIQVIKERKLLPDRISAKEEISNKTGKEGSIYPGRCRQGLSEDLTLKQGLGGQGEVAEVSPGEKHRETGWVAFRRGRGRCGRGREG